jgi:hypothetical protein
MESRTLIADKAAKEIEIYLKSLKNTIRVINVEKNQLFQGKDIDLVWEFFDERNVRKMLPIEIKGDTYYYSNNYFFETISNKSKNSKGCILYTEAEYIFYYFVDEKELHRIPTKKTVEWFKKNMDSFVTKKVQTKFENGKIVYGSEGKLIPRKVLQRFIKEVKIKNIKNILNQKVGI